MVIVYGRLVYPDSKDQCQFGVKMLAIGNDSPFGIPCCVKTTCGPGFEGVCQNQHGQCQGNIVVYVFYFKRFVSSPKPIERGERVDFFLRRGVVRFGLSYAFFNLLTHY